MEKYVEAYFEEFSLDYLEEHYSPDDCTVVCTYMYGYCGDAEGWGTTYCPDWGSPSTDDDDDDDDDDSDDDE